MSKNFNFILDLRKKTTNEKFIDDTLTNDAMLLLFKIYQYNAQTYL